MIRELLYSLEGHLQHFRPALIRELHSGLTNDEITVMERRYKKILPAALKSLYRWHNGQDLSGTEAFVNGYYFFPLDKMLQLLQEGKSEDLKGCFPIFGNVSGSYPSYICYNMNTRENWGMEAVFCRYLDEPFDEEVAENLEMFLTKLNNHYQQASSKEKCDLFINFYGKKRSRHK